MKKNIAVLPGDGVGPEVTAQAVRVLKKIGEKFDHQFFFTEGLIGAVAIDKTGNPYPEKTHNLCISSDAILFGAIGDPKYDNDPKATVRPEQGLLAMRKALVLYANLRPIFAFENFVSKSPLKPEIIQGVDFIVVRELIGGIYFGKKGRNKNGTEAFDVNTYTKDEITRVATYAFELVKKRSILSPQSSFPRPLGKGQGEGVIGKLTVVDKANVLETSRLWRETIQEMAKDYPDVTVEFMFVDNASMQIIKRPIDFDVILTENMFGDILTDEASVITGSLGMLPSASIGEKTSVYEPIHGSFPKAAGKNIANPIGTILSAAMMLDLSFDLQKESNAIKNAVEKVLSEGYGTKDIAEKNPLSTSEFTDKIIESI